MSTESKARSKLGTYSLTVLATAALTLSGTFVGALTGVLFVRFFVPATGMGWDRLADALGGLMLGGVVGLFGGALLSWRLERSTRNRAALAALASCFALLLLLRALAGDRQDGSPAHPPKTPTAAAPGGP
ncbi:MAG: hypothetical protein AAF690_18065 [Acidobacteriota bacterium]